MPLVLNISSDEEEGLEDELKLPDFDWIKDFLFTSDDEKSDDSDEVVVIGEKKAELKSKSSTLPVKYVDGDGGGDDDDDDCVILEGDPEKGMTSVVEEVTESDELVVVGEKGEIACRDFPHSRHLCVKFPFSSTPHQKHCSLCHCNVCDSLAPCPKWGTGLLSTDHCHANDKEPWKTLRKNFKRGLSSPLSASTNHGTSPRSVCPPQHNEFLLGDVINLSPNSVLPTQASKSTAIHTLPLLNSLPLIQGPQLTIMQSLSPTLNSSLQNQVSRTSNAPVMSTATNVTIPNVSNHDRFQESGSTLVRNRYPVVPKPVLGVRSHTIQKERGNGASSLRTQLLRSRVSKVAGNTLTKSSSSRDSSVLGNCLDATQQQDNYHVAATGFLNYRNCNGRNDASHPITLPLYSQPSSQLFSLSSTVASEMQAYSQPLPQSNVIANFHQTCIQASATHSSNAVCLNSNPQRNEPQIIIQNENIIQCGTAGQGTCQPRPHEESPSEAAHKLSTFDLSSSQNVGQSIEPVIECSPPLQNSGSMEEQLAGAKESRTPFRGSTCDKPLNESSQSSNSLDDFDSWLYDVPMLTDGLFPSDMSIPSPDPDPADMGMPIFYLD